MLVKISLVVAPYAAPWTVLMIFLIVKMRITDFGSTPVANHVSFSVSKVVLFGVLGYEVSLARSAKVMGRGMDKMVFTMRVLPELSLARLAFKAVHNTRRRRRHAVSKELESAHQ
ncbi:hypothetical protein MJO28_005229 [Puccinia striiformis f. sp. tritici]|nr:hypothetical protein MJO28_005229 [Puccinia striiformis f. sp. tritici]POW15620.1 hypothetical protein PSTT_01995 [Puccinia striiformis]